MIKYFCIAIDVFVIIATLITCFFMDEQFSWWIKVFIPFCLISVMIIHIAYLNNFVVFFVFFPFPIIFSNYIPHIA
ncbi:hypothetical protein lam_439 [Candidatus Liberibacter americanus str. Sao Paulo]|uniref:Uncharacterized protein n=1 Tax=Candidatus Liberibacter americanus str. Sao Paulo TaxID=1261131 RepID=U6B7G4_9HYPH|nr:hypothetical protein lam_439 [Candidatus Liberibacter americanus str. Sao Paulo]EMS36184.1 hypothetical protein G653_03026 [Candidatus Liberibacter americanus PW_SP]